MIGKIFLGSIILYFTTFGITILTTKILNKIKKYQDNKKLQEKGIVKRVNIEDKNKEVNKIWNESLKCWEIIN